jgi:hypothetical protein
MAHPLSLTGSLQPKSRIIRRISPYGRFSKDNLPIVPQQEMSHEKAHGTCPSAWHVPKADAPWINAEKRRFVGVFAADKNGGVQTPTQLIV